RTANVPLKAPFESVDSVLNFLTPVGVEPLKTSTVAPFTPFRSARSEPLKATFSTPFVVDLDAFAFSDSVVGSSTRACTSTVPAASTLPLAVWYGVAVPRQRYSPGEDGFAIALVVNSAVITLAPSVARPGVPAGMSDGGRQKTIDADAIAFSGGVVIVSMDAGTVSGVPAAWRFRAQIAVCVAVPVQ